MLIQIHVRAQDSEYFANCLDEAFGSSNVNVSIEHHVDHGRLIVGELVGVGDDILRHALEDIGVQCVGVYNLGAHLHDGPVAFTLNALNGYQEHPMMGYHIGSPVNVHNGIAAVDTSAAVSFMKKRDQTAGRIAESNIEPSE